MVLKTDIFLSSFLKTDVLVLTDVYGAGEDPIPGVDSESLAEDIKRISGVASEVIYAGSLQAAQIKLSQMFSDGDLLLCLGAGTITRLSEKLISEALEVIS